MHQQTIQTDNPKENLTQNHIREIYIKQGLQLKRSYFVQFQLNCYSVFY